MIKQPLITYENESAGNILIYSQNFISGGNAGRNLVFYGGYIDNIISNNITTVLTPTGALYQPESTIGAARRYLAGPLYKYNKKGYKWHLK